MRPKLLRSGNWLDVIVEYKISLLFEWDRGVESRTPPDFSLFVTQLHTIVVFVQSRWTKH